MSHLNVLKTTEMDTHKAANGGESYNKNFEKRISPMRCL